MQLTRNDSFNVKRQQTYVFAKREKDVVVWIVQKIRNAEKQIQKEQLIIEEERKMIRKKQI